jgi:hypothetical protein
MKLDIYYICIDHKKEGPFLLSDLLKMICEKKMCPKTFVWANFKGMEDEWREAGKIKELAPIFESPPPLPCEMLVSREDSELD